MLVKVASTLFLRRTKTFVVPQLRQTLADSLPIGNLLQITERHLVLGFNPCVGVGRVGILQPTVWIYDLDPVVIIDLIDSLRMGIHEGCDGPRVASIQSDNPN